MHPGDPYNTDEEEDSRLRRKYDALPKTPWHGEETPNRHPDIRPEWVVRVIREPYDQWELIIRGERRTVLVGRVPEFSQWIMVVFVGDTISGHLLTAYANRRLEPRYGGRPWRTAQ